MLGYHVHEKAVLLCIVPLALEAARSLRRARIFQRLSTIGHFSLLPLIYTQDECLLKVCPPVCCPLNSWRLYSSDYFFAAAVQVQAELMRVPGS